MYYWYFVKINSIQFQVVEVVNADALVIKTGDEYKKITLSSIRPPRLTNVNTEDQPRVSEGFYWYY